MPAAKMRVSFPGMAWAVMELSGVYTPRISSKPRITWAACTLSSLGIEIFIKIISGGCALQRSTACRPSQTNVKLTPRRCFILEKINLLVLLSSAKRTRNWKVSAPSSMMPGGLSACNGTAGCAGLMATFGFCNASNRL